MSSEVSLAAITPVGKDRIKSRDQRLNWRAFRVGLFAFVAIYPLFSLSLYALRMRSHPNEIYPVFSWALFCSVPTENSDFAIRIIEIDGQELKPDVWLEDAHQWFPNLLPERREVAKWTLRAASLHETNATETPDWCRRIENDVFLQKHEFVLYQVCRRTFDVRDRVRTGRFTDINVIRQFSCQVPK